MRRNYNAALTAVLKHEGGYVDHPRDPGGATNKGITRRTLANWRGVKPYSKLSKNEVRNISDQEVADIYRVNYWERSRCDELPAGLDFAVFDYAVNSGPSRAIMHLQEILGVSRDGRIGPITLGKIRARNAQSLTNKLCDRRLRFLKGLSTWKTFGRGWKRRVDEVRSMAISLNKAAPQADKGGTKGGLAEFIAALLAFISNWRK